MVAFSYTRASSDREISKAVDQAIEQTFGNTQDQVSQQNRTTNELIRQLNQSRSNLGQETYDTYRNRLEIYKQNLNTEYDQVVQAQQNINIRAANQTADRDIPTNQETQATVNTVTAEESKRIDNPPPETYNYDFAGSDDPELYGYTESSFPEKNEDDAKPIVIEAGGVGNEPRTNKLHAYSTYTYGISLHYMTLKEYNAFVTGRVRYSPRNQRVLIASAGRRNADLVRNPNFELDMYISDFKMVTVIGLNPISKGTNAVTVEFTIQEPISASLIERLAAVAQENNIQNWIEMPLVLQIDFFAINPDGTYSGTPIQEVTKYLCVKITNLTFEITAKGAEYKCTAIPMSHQAYSKSTISVPANFEITSKTIGEFFSANENSSRVNIEAFEATREVREANTTGTVQNNTYKVLSLADALNQYQRELTKPIKGKRYQEFADEYRFEVDAELASATLTIPNKHNLANAPMQNDVNNKDVIDKERVTIPINAGSNLLEVINQQMRNSSLYRNQIKNDKNDADPKSNNPLKLHHTTSKVEYTDEWDSIRKMYRRKITYFIKKFEFNNHVYPEAELSLPKKIQKQYNYIYTGQNLDIRDFKIQFNTLWFQALTSFENRFEKDNLNITDDPLEYSEGIDLSGQRPRAVVKSKETSRELFPRRIFRTTVNNATQQQSDGSKKSIQAVDLWSSVFNYKGGDMISLTLEIAGDPDFIKQDDVWYPSGSDMGYTDTGIKTDRQQVYINVNFQLRDDIDLSTGLYKKSEYNSAFSGVYSVVTVENYLKDGVFYQRLICYRLFGQEEKRFDLNRNRPSQSPEGSRTSSDKNGLAISIDDYEEELATAGLRAFEERESASQFTYYGGSLEDSPPTTVAATEFREWETVDVVNSDDYPGGGA